ncbi:MAG: aldo/keto reductase [Elusimicrobia bacterium]|nr:aldo/keto reductase [Elusimicrobiota bacterium]
MAPGVSKLAFGGGAVSGEAGGYGFGAMDEATAIALLRASNDRGIRVFDTAPIYGYGVSEERIGKAFEGRRDRVSIVSKCGVDWDADKTPKRDISPETTRRMLADSLRRVCGGYIDLYFIHAPDGTTDVRRTMEVLAEAKRAGKIRAIGLSKFYDPEEIRRAESIERVDCFQSEFNLFEPRAKDQLFPICRDRKIGFMAFGVLDKGLLSGRVTRGRVFDPADFRRNRRVPESRFAAMERLAPLLSDAGYSPLELALGYVLSHPEVTEAMIGVKSLEQLESALAALARVPPDALIQKALQAALPAPA